MGERTHWRQERIYVRRRRIAFTLAAVLVLALASSVVALWQVVKPGPAQAVGTAPSSSAGTEPLGTDAPTTPKVIQTDPSSATSLGQIDRFTGGITPKSVDASGQGLVLANNMIYSHSITVYDSTTHKLVNRLSDSIDLSKFGFAEHKGIAKGGPVEAAWTQDAKYAYVSNYVMSGPGFKGFAKDECSPKSGFDNGFVYRYNVAKKTWDQAIEVGAVPKFVAITPDQKKVVISNWCDFTISIIDRATAKQTKVIKLAAQPRGIVIMPDNKTAYVAAMYGNKVFRVNMETGEHHVIMDVNRPRHLVLSPDNKFLYLAASGTNRVYKIDTATDKVVAQVVSGPEPRSMAISQDGTALYVVNYFGKSASKITTADMKVIQRVPTDPSPIGITYDDATHQVWVACYGGSMLVFDDTKRASGSAPPTGYSPSSVPTATATAE
ncbi:MAG TPA: cytochrome D1 domain-containing protein [Flexivirga sp.]|uniref:YncE family protein n=1 Tax=Flexivirga sp. TaxID=1962927 RepID=UPI002CC8723F|nr:cytochrome D1 domain-containing protein [Flexivirga sp.]HWC23544.1 cytochrome D1 domain-containing protein [Flexivirga sp.]